MNHTEFSAYTPGILSVIRGVNTLFRKRPANLVHDWNTNWYSTTNESSDYTTQYSKYLVVE